MIKDAEVRSGPTTNLIWYDWDCPFCGAVHCQTMECYRCGAWLRFVADSEGHK